MYDLGLFVGWFEILHDFVDYQDYMCLSSEIGSLWRLFLYLCSNNLDGSVTEKPFVAHTYILLANLLEIATRC
jgi:hypothetical protein